MTLLILITKHTLQLFSSIYSKRQHFLINLCFKIQKIKIMWLLVYFWCLDLFYLYRSTINVVSQPLIFIIMSCSITLYRFFYQPLNILHQFFVSSTLKKATSQLFWVVFVEAFHIFALRHHLYPLHNLSFIVSNVFESKEEKIFEITKDIWIFPVH